MPFVNSLTLPRDEDHLIEVASWCFGCAMYHGDGGEFTQDYRINSLGNVVIAMSTDDDYESYDDEPYEDYSDDYYGSVIMNYGFKPRPVFHGQDSRTFLGMEVELEGPEPDWYSNNSVSVTTIAEETQNILGDLAYFKEDGSLSYGFELVTHPMTYRWALDNFPWRVFRDMESQGMEANSHTGIHVHVSRSAFDNSVHMYKWMKLMWRNQAMVQRIARRRSVGYASWESTWERNRSLDYAKNGQRDSDRYSILNTQNRNTIEVRCFHSSTNPDHIKAALGLIDAGVEYTRTLTAQDIARFGGWDEDGFKAFLNREPVYAETAELANATRFRSLGR